MTSLENRAMRIYVAGPYSAPGRIQTENNVKTVIECGVEILKKGHYPYLPHLTHYVELLSQEKGLGLAWEDYIDWDIAWLELCDALLYLGSSKGADLELAYAKKLGKVIFHHVNDVPTLSHRRQNLTKLRK